MSEMGFRIDRFHCINGHSMSKGHPDAGQRHLCHALKETYVRGASIDVATLDFALLRSQHGRLQASSSKRSRQ